MGIFWTVVQVFEHKQMVFCGILENYSSVCTRKRVESKLFKFVKYINNRFCTGYKSQEVAKRLLENSEKKKNLIGGCRGPEGGATGHFQPWVTTKLVVSRQGRQACVHCRAVWVTARARAHDIGNARDRFSLVPGRDINFVSRHNWVGTTWF